jgi:hypothetical protein
LACRSTQFLAVGFDAGQPSPYLAHLLWAQGQRQLEQQQSLAAGMSATAPGAAVSLSGQQGGESSSSSSSGGSLANMPEVWCSWHLHLRGSLPAKLARVQDPEYLPGTPMVLPEWQPLLLPAESDQSVMNKSLQVCTVFLSSPGQPSTSGRQEQRHLSTCNCSSELADDWHDSAASCSMVVLGGCRCPHANGWCTTCCMQVSNHIAHGFEHPGDMMPQWRLYKSHQVG